MRLRFTVSVCDAGELAWNVSAGKTTQLIEQIVRCVAAAAKLACIVAVTRASIRAYHMNSRRR
jgi:2-keto-3-deoxy-L-rhamnonate aldolase RhmA